MASIDNPSWTEAVATDCPAAGADISACWGQNRVTTSLRAGAEIRGDGACRIKVLRQNFGRECRISLGDAGDASEEILGNWIDIIQVPLRRTRSLGDNDDGEKRHEPRW